MLAMLSSAEATLRVDYIHRVIAKRKDPTSKAFTALYKERGLEVRLREDLLETWKSQLGGADASAAIAEFRGALKLRHWLAHGRYWKPRLGREYDPVDVFDICRTLLARLPP